MKTTLTHPTSRHTSFASGLYFPQRIVFDSAGNLFTTSRGDSDNLIYEFAPDGTESSFATSGVSTPDFIAIQVTPEPSTWALARLGVLAFLAFRRKNRLSSQNN